MEKFRVIIADDEAPARDELKHILSKMEEITLVGEARNGIEALKLIEKTNPDLALLDIEMPGLNGIEVAKRLLKLKNAPGIIFSTAYDTYAVSAFEVNAIDYILKPFDESRIKKGILKVGSLLKEKEKSVEKLSKLLAEFKDSESKFLSKIPIKTKGKISFIEVSDVVYARSEGGLVFISDDGKEFLTEYTSLEKLESDLDPERFHRVHRSYLANLEKMKEISPLGSGHYTIRCKTATGKYIEIPLSRRQAKSLKEKYRF